MEFSFQLLSCPKCKQPYLWHIEKLLFLIPGNSGLGPSEVRCSKCGSVFNTELCEWRTMNVPQKIRYIYLSLFYDLIIGFTFSLVSLSIFGYANQITDPLFPSNRLLLLGTVFFSLLIIGIDMIRVELSNRRIENPFQGPMTISFWTWYTNPQVYGILAIFMNLLILILIVFVL